MQKEKKLSGDGFRGAVDGRIQDDGEINWGSAMGKEIW